MELREKLIELRKAKGWERGVIAPATMNLAALGRLYGVPLDELVNGEQPPQEEAAPAVALVEESEAAEPQKKPKLLRLAGGIAAATLILLVAAASVITIVSAVFKEPEKPKDGPAIINQDDMEWEDIDWDDSTPYEWTWKISE